MEEEEVGGTPSSLPKKVGKRKIIQHSWPAEGPLALVPFGIDPDSAEEKVGQPMLFTRCSLSLALTLTLTLALALTLTLTLTLTLALTLTLTLAPTPTPTLNPAPRQALRQGRAPGAG